MATIELSSVGSESWMTYLTSQMMDLNVQRSGGNVHVGSVGLLTGTATNNPGLQASAMINIMGGSVPTSLTGLSSYADRSADVLASFTTPYGIDVPAGVQDFTMVFTNINPVIVSSNYKEASGSGTATWFRWMVVTRPQGTQPPDTMIHQIIGTVGLSGSGADLEMDDTAIVAGNQYRISSLRLLFPSTFTY